MCCYWLRSLHLTFTVVCYGKADCPLFVNYSRCIPVKNTLGWSALVFCGCELTELVYVVLRVVTAVRELYFRLVISETSNKWRPVFVKQTGSCGDRESCFWQDLYVCPRPSSRVFGNSTHTGQVNCILWSKTQYFHSPACFHGAMCTTAHLPSVFQVRK
jgi:hypothetical protein